MRLLIQAFLLFFATLSQSTLSLALEDDTNMKKKATVRGNKKKMDKVNKTKSDVVDKFVEDNMKMKDKKDTTLVDDKNDNDAIFFPIDDFQKVRGPLPDDVGKGDIYIPNDHVDEFENNVVEPLDDVNVAKEGGGYGYGYGGYGYGGYGYGGYGGHGIKHKYCYIRKPKGYYYRKLEVDESSVTFFDEEDSDTPMNIEDNNHKSSYAEIDEEGRVLSGGYDGGYGYHKRPRWRRCYKYGHYKCCYKERHRAHGYYGAYGGDNYY